MDSANGAMAVRDQSLTEWRMHRGAYLGDISALCFLHLPNLSLPFLLAGTLLSPHLISHCLTFICLILVDASFRFGF